MGEDTSDARGLGKNREPVGFGGVVSRDGVVGCEVGRAADPVPLTTDERIDNKACGVSELVCELELSGIGIDDTPTVSAD